jgi:CubicO group peptidase (beta-lactamase class C family)
MNLGISSPQPALRLSRRRFLAATAAAAALSPLGSPWSTFAAKQTPAAQPWSAAEEIPATMEADASPRFRAVADAVRDAMVEYGIPGTALGILMDGEEEHAVFGLANLETGEPVTPETRFQIGSVGKTYTGTAIMQAVSSGKLDLYAPVRTYLPDFELMDESVAARVTVHHLLTHTGGWWGDTFFDTGDDDAAIARLVQEVLPTLPQQSPLGMFASYNNAGISVLGRLLEVVEDMTYREVMQQYLLDPLGMDNSTFDIADVERGSYSLGYHSGPDGTLPQTPLHLPRSIEPAGANFWSTTPEQLRFARLHLADGVAPDGDRLLPAYTARLMRTAQSFFTGTSNVQMGLTWFVQDVAGIRFAQHIGDTFGQHTALVLAPDKGFALILLTNAEPGGAQAEAAVLTAAAKTYLDMSDEAAQVGIGSGLGASPDTAPLRLPAAELDAYAGRFATPADAVSLRVENDELLLSLEALDLPGQIVPAIPDQVVVDYPVTVIGGDRLAVGSNVIAAYAREPDGEIGWLRVGVRSSPKVTEAGAA